MHLASSNLVGKAYEYSKLSGSLSMTYMDGAKIKNEGRERYSEDAPSN